MATEFLVVKNRAVSTLDGAINDSVTTVNVAAGEGANFPSSFPFHVTVNDERMSVTGRSTDALTVVRAQQDSSAAAHFDGDAIALQITAKSITDLNEAVNTLEDAGSGAHASSHEDGGGDEISVASLSGVLADEQHVIDSEAVLAIQNTAVVIGQVAAASGTFTVLNVKAATAAKLKWFERAAAGENYVQLTAPDLAENIFLVWPDAYGNAGEFLQTDADGFLSWAAAGGGGGAVTREGSDTTEATTTSTSSVDILSLSSLSIGATSPLLIVCDVRKTSGHASIAGWGLKINSTALDTITIRTSATDQAENGYVHMGLGSRVANYDKAMFQLNQGTPGWANQLQFNIGGTFTAIPTATVTDTIITGRVSNASNTNGVDELHTYSLGTS